MVGRVIKGALVAGLAGLALAGAVAARDDDGPSHRGGGHWSRLSPEDREAFAEARIAGLHAGLRLTPDQEKLWPPVEAAMRDLAKQRRDRMAGMRERKRMDEDAPGALRAMADAATARGAALGKLADASGPLYATLDPDQKRRAMILARPMGGPGHHGGRHRHGPRDGGPRDER